jgi:hypothetical protein
MTRRPFVSIAALSLAAFFAAPARAQNSPATPPTEQAQPAAAPQANAPDAKPAGAPQLAKRVWTNENMPSHDPAGASASQGSNGSTVAPNGGARPKASTSNKDEKWYRDQISKLQAKLPALDQGIADLQAAINGKPTGNGETSSRPRGVKTDDWATQLRDLQKQRDDILARIDALKDEARHKGVSPNAMP